MSLDSSSDDLARSWVEHLRTGGTDPWWEWVTRDQPQPLPTSGKPVPGAVQLELVRRLALRRHAMRDALPPDRFAALADRALQRSGPGRGQPDLPLLHPGGGVPTTFGAPPLDPSAAPMKELARVGVGLLADLLVELGPLSAHERTHAVRGLRNLFSPRRGFHLAGAPITVAGVRASLAEAGHAEGGRSPEVVLLAEPLDVHLAQVWSTRVQHGAPVRWETFAGRWARRDALPPSADLPAIAAFWAAKVGSGRVHVVAAVGGPSASLRAGADVLGVRLPSARPPVDVHALSPEETDVLRRLNRVLNVRADEAARPGLQRRARSLLSDVPPHGLALPTSRRDWAESRAERLAEQLRAGGYPVVGDLSRIAPRHDGAARPRRPEVLTLVLDTCLRAAAQKKAQTRAAGARSR